jgi:hypothetical protein
MQQLTWPTGLMMAGIVLIVAFVLLAPTGTLARATNAVGNAIQKIVAWIASRFS